MVRVPDIRRLSDGLRRRGSLLLVLWLGMLPGSLLAVADYAASAL